MSLRVRDLTVSYGSQPVLAGLDLEVAKGEFVAVVGESGCGKTTLLSAIAGFEKYRGSITRPMKVGMVFQGNPLFPWMTAADNIAFGLAPGKGTADHYLKMAGLQGKGSSYPHELSGGQVQRVALARTLAADCDLILMDEPYGALDGLAREKMQRWLLGVWESRRMTVVFVTHSIEEAAYLSDRILVLAGGRISREFQVGLRRPRWEAVKFSPEFMRLRRAVIEEVNPLK